MKFAVTYGVVGHLGFEEAVLAISKAGYDGVEMSTDCIMEGRARPLAEKELPGLCKAAGRCAEVIRKNGLEIIGLAAPYFCLSYFEETVFESYYRIAQAFGSPGLKVHGTLYGPGNYWALLKENQRKLEVLLRYGETYGIRTLLELHHGTLNESCSGAYLIMKDLDPSLIGVIHDPQNMVVSGKENWRMGLEILGDYVAYVHWKNCRFSRKNGGKWASQLCGLDEGLVDWREFIQALKDTGFAGYLCNEYRGDKQSVPLKSYLDDDLTYMKGLVSSQQ